MTDKPTTLAGSLTSLVWGLTARPTTLPALVAPVIPTEAEAPADVHYGPVRPQATPDAPADAAETMQATDLEDVVEDAADDIAEDTLPDELTLDFEAPRARKPRWSRARRREAAAALASETISTDDVTSQPSEEEHSTFESTPDLSDASETQAAEDVDSTETDAPEPVQYLTRAERRRAERIGRKTAQALAESAADDAESIAIDETVDDAATDETVEVAEAAYAAETVLDDAAAETVLDDAAAEETVEVAEAAETVLDDTTTDETVEVAEAAETADETVQVEAANETIDYEASIISMYESLSSSEETSEEPNEAVAALDDIFDSEDTASADADLFDVGYTPAPSRRELRRAARRERAEMRRAEKLARAEASAAASTDPVAELAFEPLSLDEPEAEAVEIVDAEPESPFTLNDLAVDAFDVSDNTPTPVRETRAQRRARITEEKAARKAEKLAANTPVPDAEFDFIEVDSSYDTASLPATVDFPSAFPFAPDLIQDEEVETIDSASFDVVPAETADESETVDEVEASVETETLIEDPDQIDALVETEVQSDAVVETEAEADAVVETETEPANPDIEDQEPESLTTSGDGTDYAEPSQEAEESHAETEAASEADETADAETAAPAVEDAVVTAAAVASATVAAAVVAAVQEALAHQLQTPAPAEASPAESSAGPVRPAPAAADSVAAPAPTVIAVPVPMPEPAAEQAAAVTPTVIGMPFAVPGTVEMTATINEATIIGSPERPATPAFKYDDYRPESPTFLGQADPNAYEAPRREPSRPVAIEQDYTEPLNAPSQGRSLRDRFGKRRTSEQAEIIDQPSYSSQGSYREVGTSSLPGDDFRDESSVDLTAFDPSKYFGLHVDRTPRADSGPKAAPAPRATEEASQPEGSTPVPTFTPPVLRGERDSREVLQMIRELSTLRNQPPQF